MKVHFLGTGGPLPTEDRQNLSLLLEVEDRVVLVDCSGSPTQSILRANASLDDLTDVVLTHSHTDHLYALPSLLHCQWYRIFKGNAPSDYKIRLHALDETFVVANQLIDAFEIRKKNPPLHLEEISADPDSNEILNIQLGNYIIGAFRVIHGTMPAFGLYIDKPDGKRLLYSADAIVNEAIRKQLTPQTQILIHDCGGGMKGNSSHAGAEEIAGLIHGSSLETVYLVHFPNLSKREIQDIVSYVSHTFSGTVVAPNDGDEIDF